MPSCINDRVTLEVNRCNAVVASNQSEQSTRRHIHDDGHDGQGRAQGLGVDRTVITDHVTLTFVASGGGV